MPTPSPTQLLVFAQEPGRAERRRYGPCNDPLWPQHMAPADADDAADAVGHQGADHCCAVHYVRHLRWKYNLDD